MQKINIHPFFIVLTLLAVTAVLLACSPKNRLNDFSAISMALPEQVGQWQGYSVVFCQNAQCGRPYMLQPDGALTTCPNCGSDTDLMSVGEHRLLPSDTEIARKRYLDPAGNVMMVQIALSGIEQKSIHRPQQCLEAQGLRILNNYTVSVPIKNRDPLQIMMLNTQSSRAPADHPESGAGTYAYWFLTDGKETPYHLRRLLWMAIDRIVHSRVDRWAYVGVSAARNPANQDHVQVVTQFLAQLYPLLKANNITTPDPLSPPH